MLQDGREVEPRNQVAEVCEVQEFRYWGVEDGEVVEENGCEVEEWVDADSEEDILSDAGAISESNDKIWFKFSIRFFIYSILQKIYFNFWKYFNVF